MNKHVKYLIATLLLPAALYILALVGYCAILTFEYVASGEFSRDRQVSAASEARDKRLPTSN
jgi:hypothetical protein